MAATSIGFGIELGVSNSRIAMCVDRHVEVVKNDAGDVWALDSIVFRSRAIELSRQPNKLFDAADLMEEAFNRWPGLRRQYEYQLKPWRRGISM
jgi:hypothetical protein